MVDIMQITVIGLAAALLALIVKQYRPDIAMLITLTTGIVLFVLSMGNINTIILAVEALAHKANLDSIYLSTVIKIIGIAYIAEFGSQICKDTGEGTIASKIELGGKILMMVLALPILTGLIESILKILP